MMCIICWKSPNYHDHIVHEKEKKKKSTSELFKLTMRFD